MSSGSLVMPDRIFLECIEVAAVYLAKVALNEEHMRRKAKERPIRDQLGTLERDVAMKQRKLREAENDLTSHRLTGDNNR